MGKKHHLGEIELDALIKENHEFRAQATEHPVESGQTIVDHINNLPMSVSIEGIISNTPLTLIGVTAVQSLIKYANQESNDFAERAFQKIEELFSKREPITIATSLKDYRNMVLESLSVERGGGSCESLHFRATAKQIRIVTQKTITIPEPKSDRVKKKKTMGKQETKTASVETQNAVKKSPSLLGQLSGFFSGGGA